MLCGQRLKPLRGIVFLFRIQDLNFTFCPIKYFLVFSALIFCLEILIPAKEIYLLLSIRKSGPTRIQIPARCHCKHAQSVCIILPRRFPVWTPFLRLRTFLLFHAGGEKSATLARIGEPSTGQQFRRGTHHSCTPIYHRSPV